MKEFEEVNRFVLEMAENLSSINKKSLLYQDIRSLEAGENLFRGWRDMERQAHKSLLRYYDYAAKICQYHLLKACGEGLNWKELLDRVDHLAKNGLGVQEELKKFYFGELSGLLKKVFDDIQQREILLGSMNLPLTRQQRMYLSSGEVVPIELDEVFPSFMEEVRIKDIRFEVTSFLPQGEAKGRGYALQAVHPGNFYIKKNGKSYYFEFLKGAGGDTLWEFHEKVPQGKFHLTGKKSSGNPFFSTLAGDWDGERLLTPLPGGITRLSLKLNKEGLEGVPLELEGVSLVVDYQYRRKKSSPHTSDKRWEFY